MLFELNFKSGKPAYLQIVDQVMHAGASGSLRAGEALPSIRVLAERLRINRNTVAKAYSELEHQGVIEIIQGKGAFLSSKASPFSKDLCRSVLRDAVDSVFVQAHHFQVSDEDLLDIVHERMTEFQKRKELSTTHLGESHG